MNKCKICEEIEFWKNYHKISPMFEDKLFVKIAVYTFEKGQRKIKGNQISTMISKAYNLKYCPTCGRKIRREHE